MKFRVIGSSRETGARMTLEFEAQSRAAAERKAKQQGMAVNRVEIFGEPANEEPMRVARSSGHGWLLRALILLALAAAVYYWLHSHGIIL